MGLHPSAMPPPISGPLAVAERTGGGATQRTAHWISMLGMGGPPGAPPTLEFGSVAGLRGQPVTNACIEFFSGLLFSSFALFLAG